jgi:hypothetical protein
MSPAETALLVIDAQESFRQRPYWSDSDLPLFVERLQALIDGAKSHDGSPRKTVEPGGNQSANRARS